MIKKVYLVVKLHEGLCLDVSAVFKTKERAEKFCDAINSTHFKENGTTWIVSERRILE